jgi:5'-3' exonuclease
LLVSGDDDKLWPSSFMADAIMTRLRAKGHPFADKWLHYPGAGHGIGIAYATYTHSMGNEYVDFGGNPKANATASDDSWPQAMAFLQTALSKRSERLQPDRNSASLRGSPMQVYLVDGTYELFRHYFAVPSATDSKGQEVGAVRGVLASILSMLERGATHVGVATDHIVESFRNELYAGYKTGEGVPPDLFSQFAVLERALEAMGVVVWPMVEYEADDALASAAAKAALDKNVSRVFICTPDKDLSQSVAGTRIVQMDRRRDIIRDEAGVIAKFGVGPKSIPDYLALVGDSSDGYPGVSGFGAKAAAATLSRYPHLEEIPNDWHKWHASISRAKSLSASLFNNWDDALLFRTLATLRLDVPVFQTVEDLRWKGPKPEFDRLADQMKQPDLMRRATSVRSAWRTDPP